MHHETLKPFQKAQGGKLRCLEADQTWMRCSDVTLRSENYTSLYAQVLFQLKFTSKQLEKMSKKAEKDQHKEEASI